MDPKEENENNNLPGSGKEEAVKLVVADSEGNAVQFKLKKNRPLKKLFDAYCDKQGRSQNSIRFLHNGVRINPTQTAEKIGIKDGETIDAMAEQRGGLGNISR
ncbi:MAG: ubiquitin-like protein [Amphiamblys sp. WSBS2006]|nr:MAG: ubiquitin-like protein [Amphiamblys sp. WSBS2006]